VIRDRAKVNLRASVREHDRLITCRTRCNSVASEPVYRDCADDWRVRRGRSSCREVLGLSKLMTETDLRFDTVVPTTSHTNPSGVLLLLCPVDGEAVRKRPSPDVKTLPLYPLMFCSVVKLRLFLLT